MTQGGLNGVNDVFLFGSVQPLWISDFCRDEVITHIPPLKNGGSFVAVSIDMERVEICENLY